MMQKQLDGYNNQIFYIAYVLMIINATLIKNINNTVSRIIIVVYIALYVLNMLLKKYTIKEFLILHVGFLIIGIIFLKSKETDILILGVILLSSSRIDFKKVVKLDFITRLIGVICTILFSLTGITTNFIMYRIKEPNYTIEVRNSLGFIHPNTLSVNIFILILAYVYIRYKSIKIIECVTLVVIMYTFSEITGSRTGIICIAILILSIILERKTQFSSRKIFKFIFIYGIPICVLISFTLTILYSYNIEVINVMNKIFTGRIRSANYFLENYGISLFGQSLELISIVQAQQTSEQMRILDNLYISLGVRSGIVFLIIYNIIYVKLNKFIVNQNYKCEMILITNLMIYGFMEKVPISPELNFTVLLLGIVLFKDTLIKNRN